MRPLVFVLLSFFLFGFSQTGPPPVVAWLTPTEHDFGDLPANQPVFHEFRFRNVSPDTLFIDNVRTACGCTAPTWPDGPTPPDSTATIQVEYDARDNGYFRRYIKVYVSGQRRAEKLFITGYVE